MVPALPSAVDRTTEGATEPNDCQRSLRGERDWNSCTVGCRNRLKDCTDIPLANAAKASAFLSITVMLERRVVHSLSTVRDRPYDVR